MANANDYVPAQNIVEVNDRMKERPTGAQIEAFVLKIANDAVRDLKAEQHAFNDKVCGGFGSAKTEFDKLARSIVSVQKELVSRSCIVKGIPTIRPAIKKDTKGKGAKKQIYVLKEYPHETLEQFRTKVLPTLGINPQEVAIESATRFMQNPEKPDVPGMRVRFMSQQDRYKVFSKLGKLKGQAHARGWHFSSDFPEYLAEAHKKMEFVAAEYRARYPDRNTNTVHDKMEVRLTYRMKNDRNSKWEFVPKEETTEIMALIQAGKGIVAEKKGRAKGLPQPTPDNLIEAAKNITISPVKTDATLMGRKRDEEMDDDCGF